MLITDSSFQQNIPTSRKNCCAHEFIYCAEVQFIHHQQRRDPSSRQCTTSKRSDETLSTKLKETEKLSYRTQDVQKITLNFPIKRNLVADGCGRCCCAELQLRWRKKKEKYEKIIRLITHYQLSWYPRSAAIMMQLDEIEKTWKISAICSNVAHHTFFFI